MKEVTQLDQLPAHLKDLELEGFGNFVSLPYLPSGLHSLCLEYYHSLILPPILPGSLRKLALWLLLSLENMALLPDNLKELSLWECERLKELDHIPDKLKSLKIGEMKLLQIFNFNLPQTLEHLEISNSPNIESGFEIYLLEMGSHTDSPFPSNLRELELCGSESLKILPTLPISLEELELIDCNSIIEFPLLPPHLKELKIYHCDQIKIIGSDGIPLEGVGFHGKIPSSLKKIYLYDLKELAWIDKLPPNLETLSAGGCNESGVTVSSLPQHLKDLTIGG
jgi:Leucine-rich repeat (LRR) protein